MIISIVLATNKCSQSEMSSSTGYQSMMAAMPEDIEKGGQALTVSYNVVTTNYWYLVVLDL